MIEWSVSVGIPHDRMERVGGDFFVSVPSGADAYMLRWIIHDWAEDEALAILENLRKAMKPSARLVLVESVIPDTPDFDMGKWMDVNMLVMLGGRERTAAEYRELYAKAGFELEQLIPTPSPHSIIIGRPHA
jgi:O-methyltransferase domain